MRTKRQVRWWVVAMVLSACPLAVMPAAAAELGVGVGAHAGTAGVGVDVTYSVNRFITVRGTYQQYSYSHDLSKSGIDYSGDLKLKSYGVLVDVHPLANSFRATAGLLSDKNHMPVMARSSGTITINGTPYDTSQIGRLTGDVTFERSTAVYLGIGSGNARARGLHLLFDLGVMLQGSPRANLRVTGSSLTGPEFDALLADVAAQEQKTNQDIKHYRYWPVLQVGAVYTF